MINKTIFLKRFEYAKDVTLHSGSIMNAAIITVPPQISKMVCEMQKNIKK